MEMEINVMDSDNRTISLRRGDSAKKGVIGNKID